MSDDLDLPVGRLRLRTGGSDGGHNGLKSVIAELGSASFRRLRVGVGRPAPGGTIDYVLSKFEGEEGSGLGLAERRRPKRSARCWRAGWSAR